MEQEREKEGSERASYVASVGGGGARRGCWVVVVGASELERGSLREGGRKERRWDGRESEGEREGGRER